MSQPILQKDTPQWRKILTEVKVISYRGAIVFGCPKTTGTITITGTTTITITRTITGTITGADGVIISVIACVCSDKRWRGAKKSHIIYIFVVDAVI